MTNRYVAPMAGAGLLLAGLGWRLYMARLGAVSFYAMPEGLGPELFITAEVGVVASLLLIRFLARRTLPRFLSFVLVFALLLGALTYAASDLLPYCFAPGVDCVPDAFDAVAGKLLRWSPPIRRDWPVLALLASVGLGLLWWRRSKGNTTR
jgi:hypothetical protein